MRPASYLLQGDARAIPLRDGSIQCVVTSPPYWGLRDYGVAEQIGLEPTPELYVAHLVEVFREVRRVLRDDGVCWLNLGDSYASSGGERSYGSSDNGTGRGPGTRRHDVPASGLKPKDLVGIPWLVAKALQAPYYTGRIKAEPDRAWLAGFLDGEGTITYVERDRGEGHTPTHDIRVFFTNCDDAPLRHFAAMTAGHVYQHENGERENRFGDRPCFRWQMGTHDSALLLRELYPYLRTKRRQAALVWTLYMTLRHKNGHARTPTDVVEKRRAIAEMVRSLNSGAAVDLPAWVEEPEPCYEPGWWLRSDIIWAKPNPMPESITDRPTKAHEYVFLLTKRERYYYDADAVKEPIDVEYLKARWGGSLERVGPNGLNTIQRSQPIGRSFGAGASPSGRNRRTVWTIATQPYPEAHFATFPEALVEPCVLAGTSERGACLTCGAPWRRVVERSGGPPNNRFRDGLAGDCKTAHHEGTVAGSALSRLYRDHGYPTINTTGWSPACSCPSAEPVPCRVLDPFSGSGTTVAVAERLGRAGIGVELKPDYLALARRRTVQAGLL